MAARFRGETLLLKLNATDLETLLWASPFQVWLCRCGKKGKLQSLKAETQGRLQL